MEAMKERQQNDANLIGQVGAGPVPCLPPQRPPRPPASPGCVHPNLLSQP